MDEGLKNSVLEIAELLKSLPEAIQPKAFEMLLSHELGHAKQSSQSVNKESSSNEVQNPKADVPADSDQKADAEDIVATDLHVKVRKFLERYSLNLGHLNGLFYKENGTFAPLYEDLKTTKTSESQIRIALLLALRRAMQDGDFEFDGEAVRQECATRKCYDAGNFTKNLNNNAILFDGFEAYAKSSPSVRLGEEGRKSLAALIKELQ